MRFEGEMTLGGWSRLWIFISAIYLAVVILFVWVTLPQPHTIPHAATFYEQLLPKERQDILHSQDNRQQEHALIEEARRRGLIHEWELPNKHVLVFSKDLPKSEKMSAIRAYWAVVEKAAATRRTEYILQALVWWAGPVLALFILGWATGWVYCGFKSQ